MKPLSMVVGEFREGEQKIPAIVIAGFRMKHFQRLTRITLESLFEIESAQHEPGIAAELAAQCAGVSLAVGNAHAGPVSADRIGATSGQKENYEKQWSMEFE